ncbi:MAG: alpha/beta hydrolase family protein [Sulfobacillus sp.]
MRGLALRRAPVVLAGMLLGLGLLSGCSLSQAQPLPAVVYPGEVTIAGSLHGKAGGVPASLRPVGKLALPAYVAPGEHLSIVGEQTYTLFYWSQGYLVQGYLDVPPGKGPFPLLVELHGGYFLSQPSPFGQPAPHSNLFWFNQANAQNFAWPSVIVFFPNYAGYGLSYGPIGNVPSNYVDVTNGLTALGHLQGLHITPNATYLLGISMGGAVAMMVAEHDKQVRAVSLLSPYPGDIEMMQWLQSQPTLDSADLQYLNYFNYYYGANLDSTKYRDNSFPYHLVGHTPLLIIAGNSDPIFPPSLMQTMYRHLKEYDPNVRLQFFPGAHAPWSFDISGTW